MIQVIYEYEGIWPDTKSVKVDGQFMGETFGAVLQVSPPDAKRRANNYLSSTISTGIYADTPILVWGKQPKWRLSLSLRLPMLENTELPGVIEIDAQTGQIIDIDTNKLTLILDMVDDFAQRLTASDSTAALPHPQ